LTLSATSSWSSPTSSPENPKLKDMVMELL
jgi:hypothetical protein